MNGVKPAPFDYHRPKNVPDTLALLNHFGDEAKLLAGGQSLVPMLNLRVARSPHLIDINDLTELDNISASHDSLEIGSLTRHHRLATDPRIAAACPILAAAAATIGHYAIRQRGTLGGSLSHADPAAQLPLIATLLKATIRVGNHAGNREIAARDFFVSSLITALDPSDMITAVRFPALAPSHGWGLEIFSQRHGDFAIVSVAATLRLAADGTVESMALALGGVATVPVSMDPITAGFAGHLPDAGWCTDVGAAVGASLTPEDDSRIPAQYRKELAETLTVRALMTAAQRARRMSP